MTQKMTQTDASRIAAATAKQTGGQVPKGSFAARAQAAASGEGAGWPSKNNDMPSGGGRQNNPPAPRR
ncbi:hypothetical protein [Pseudomonas gingeri]|uniref:hypothetical protein n=1 Tax=Pseudomonas gingeri TaxID=117681 RepID=UPI00159F8E5A|nr:hypothetical protein [Pseudomonas gingeri]NVZ67112.1 hypothetical protein [Pseudomonas gingeri]NWA12142.1 hypothetical protein [Pseudomonas gingeri]NWB34932.1 hypothetical protein [Pseudomonas gingeri]NWD04542.1 hypothetical protein [Pseudomonas gingeri]NWD51398.1 hypothetical protein [Pseudomonas gingeri]